jgi:hypothetical protein
LTAIRRGVILRAIQAALPTTKGGFAMRPSCAFSAVSLVLGLAVSGCAEMPAAPSGPGWVTLIDGTGASLAHFDRVGDSNWRAEDGAIVADRKGKDNGYLVTKKAFGDFQLWVEFWASEDANSGIFMRCRDPKNISADTCYEANIYDQAPDPGFGTGSIVRFAVVEPKYKAGGRWNVYEITAKGSKITLKLNGVQTVELDNRKYKSGPIALQHAAGVIKFRRVQIKEL